MKVSTIKEPEGKKILEVTATAADVDKAFSIAEVNFANAMGIPPQPDMTAKEAIEKQLGINDLDSVISANIIDVLTPMAINQSGIMPAFPPQPNADGTPRRGKAFSFTMEISPKPDYELTSYDPVEIVMPKLTINEDEVDAQVQQLAERNIMYETADPKPLEKGDACLIAIKCYEDGEELTGLSTDGRTYIAGQGYMPADFDEHILGMEPGETREFKFEGPGLDADLKEYSKEYDCTVTLKEIQKPVTPVIDDAWLSEFLPMYSSLEDLRSDIRSNIQYRNEEQYEMYKRELAVKSLVDRFEGSIADDVYKTASQTLVQNIQAGLQQQGMTWEDFLAQNGGEHQVNMMVMLQTREMTVQGYVLDAIFRHENLELTDDDILEACHMMNPNVNPQQVRQQFEAEGKDFVLREAAQRLKANKWVADHAKVTYQE